LTKNVNQLKTKFSSKTIHIHTKTLHYRHFDKLNTASCGRESVYGLLPVVIHTKRVPEMCWDACLKWEVLPTLKKPGASETS